MARYRRKPKLIEAMEFQVGAPFPEGVRVRAGSSNEDGKPFEVWNQEHASWIGLEVGDMIQTDLAPQDVYPIARVYFEDNFELEEA